MGRLQDATCLCSRGQAGCEGMACAEQGDASFNLGVRQPLCRNSIMQRTAALSCAGRLVSHGLADASSRLGLSRRPLHGETERIQDTSTDGETTAAPRPLIEPIGLGEEVSERSRFRASSSIEAAKPHHQRHAPSSRPGCSWSAPFPSRYDSIRRARCGLHKSHL
jgi:hypothetical protein